MELQNLEAEKNVIASLLKDNDLFFELDSLRATDFTDERNSIVFNTIDSLIRKDRRAEWSTLMSEIGPSVLKDWDKEQPFLMRYNDGNPYTTHLKQNADIVKELSIKRFMVSSLEKIAREMKNTSRSYTDFVSDLDTTIQKALESTQGGKSKEVTICIQEMIRELEKPKEEARHVKTGITLIDDKTGGISKGLLTIMAGRPGSGKSALAFNIATNTALAGIKTQLFSLEDAQEFVSRRIASRIGDINSMKLVRNSLSGEDYSKLYDAERTIHGAPLWINDDINHTAQSIFTLASRAKMQDRCDLLIVDHLGELTKSGDEYSSTSNAVRILRDCAKKLDIPVLLLCQLNRKVEDRPLANKGRMPRLSDLRDSGKIEEVARSVWLCYRPFYYTEKEEEKNDFTLFVAKSSHGITGDIELYCDLSKMYIGDDPHKYKGGY